MKKKHLYTAVLITTIRMRCNKGIYSKTNQPIFKKLNERRMAYV